MSDNQLISYPKYGSFRISTTNKTLKLRAETFLKKEPTTLEWLQSLEDDSMLIDVGANIGIYSIPSALFHVKKVIALEPEILNFNMLLKNMDLNNISSNKIEALPLAVSTKHAGRSKKIYLTHEEAGEICHQIGKNQDHLLNENSIPKTLKNNPKVACVIGLNTEPERLADIRKNRMNSLKESENKSYTDLEKIKKEVEDAKNTFRKYKWPMIDVTRKSVEETAASIIKIYDIYKQNG